MRIRYRLRFKKPILMEDHWPIPFMSGELRMAVEEGKVVGLEVTFDNQPVELSPLVTHNLEAGVKAAIVDRDELRPQVLSKLQSALAFIQCFFDVELVHDEVDTNFEPESDDEKHQIEICTRDLFLTAANAFRENVLKFTSAAVVENDRSPRGLGAYLETATNISRSII